MNDTNLTYLRLRALLGGFGLALPLLLLATNNFVLKPSISHYYYSFGGAVFIAFMFSFGIFLFSYKGRDKKKDGVLISDNLVTNVGGILAMATAFIPTEFSSSDHAKLDSDFLEQIKIIEDHSPLDLMFMHDESSYGTIHLLCAGGFLVLMGFMAFFRFTKDQAPNWKWFYRICAIVMWVCILWLVIGFLWCPIGAFDVFIAECIALVAFGIARFAKGKGYKREVWRNQQE